MELDTGSVVKLKNPQLGTRGADNLFLVYDIQDTELLVLPLLREGEQRGQRGVKISAADMAMGRLIHDYLVITDRILPVHREAVAEEIGVLCVKAVDKTLRTMVYSLVEKHYRSVHKKGKSQTRPSVSCGGRVYDESEMKALVDSSLDFWLTEGRFAAKFRKGLSSFIGIKNCVLTNSGSSANLLAVSALTSSKLREKRIKPGDEVITTACCFPTTVNPIVQNKLVPVFVDVDVDTYNVRPSQLASAISEKTRAIFMAHTLGIPFDLETVMGVAREHNLWVIEDCCDALGSRFNGRNVGTFGHLATLSFYPPHHITTGEGGAVVTDNDLLAKLVNSFRNWGRDCWCEPGHDNTCGKRFEWQLGTLPFGYDHKHIFTHLGYNLKTTDMQAAVGTAQLEKLPQFIEARKRNWNILKNGLMNEERYFIFPKVIKGADPSWFGFILTIRPGAPFTRSEIVKYLEKNKITTRMLFAGNIIRHPSLAGIQYRVHGDLKNTDFIANNSFWLGVYPGLTDTNLEYIIDKICLFTSEMDKAC